MNLGGTDQCGIAFDKKFNKIHQYWSFKHMWLANMRLHDVSFMNF